MRQVHPGKVPTGFTVHGGEGTKVKIVRKSVTFRLVQEGREKGSGHGYGYRYGRVEPGWQSMYVLRYIDRLDWVGEEGRATNWGQLWGIKHKTQTI